MTETQSGDMGKIEIKRIAGGRELKAFVRFRNELYRDCEYAVPYLISEELATLSEDKNAAFECCEAAYFMAFRDGKAVGRVAGIINRRANERWNCKWVRFGWFDFIDDEEVSQALMAAVEEWGRRKGMTEVVGPLGFTDMDHEGMLIMGFDQIGTMATIYNHPYYPQHMERMGYTKDQDWHEFKIYIPDAIPEKHLRIAEIVKKKYGLKVLKFRRRKDIMPYAHKVFETLNAAYTPLYGFAPLTERQIDYYVDIYIPLLRLDLVTVIVREEDDAVVGFGISLPNLSHALQQARGSLLPFGFFPLMKALKSKARVIDLYLTGVLPEYQNKGVNALLFTDLIPQYIKMGAEYAESNIELENNTAVQAQWDYFKREHHKSRRAFIKHL